MQTSRRVIDIGWKAVMIPFALAAMLPILLSMPDIIRIISAAYPVVLKSMGYEPVDLWSYLQL